MRLVAAEWGHEAIREFRNTTHWPHNSKDVCLPRLQIVAIGPDRIWHADLLYALRKDWETSGFRDQSLTSEDVIGGHIEWEDDGTYSCRTATGERPPAELQEFLDATLKTLLETQS